MNKCDSHHGVAQQHNILPVKHAQHEYCQKTLSGELLKEKSIEDYKNCISTPENNNKKVSHHCIHSLGPPPRPFKKARYAWEIKNYDYTLKKMTQDIPHGDNQSSALKINNVDKSKTKDHEVSNFKKDMDQANTAAKIQEVRAPDMHMIGSPHHGFNINPLLTNYGTVFGTNLNHQTTMTHDERINAFHNQIPQDPDARLIRWHTRQLCRSIFDNTVNRMLENMGFSPLTERSQALHPLLVLSLSDEDERESEEAAAAAAAAAAHQRSLESQALSAALHQKGFIPPYQYDNLESATTSDYDSSEEDSEIGEGAQDEMTDQAQLLSPNQQNTDEECYVSLNSHHNNPSLAHLVNSPVSYLSPHNTVSSFNSSLLETNQQRFSSAQNLCDYRNDCDDTDPNVHSTDYIEANKELPKLKRKEMSTQESLIQSKTNSLRLCQSVECNRKQAESEQSYAEKELNVDDNENCIPNHKPKTHIEGKVEKVLDNCHNSVLDIDGSKLNENNNNNNNNTSDSSYFMRNGIHLAMKQQGLGFQRA